MLLAGQRLRSGWLDGPSSHLFAPGKRSIRRRSRSSHSHEWHGARSRAFARFFTFAARAASDALNRFFTHQTQPLMDRTGVRTRRTARGRVTRHPAASSSAVYRRNTPELMHGGRTCCTPSAATCQHRAGTASKRSRTRARAATQPPLRHQATHLRMRRWRSQPGVRLT